MREASYVVLANLAAQREPIVIAQNGEAKVAMRDVTAFEETPDRRVIHAFNAA